MAEPCKHCGGTGLEPFVDGSMRYAEHPMTQPYTDADVDQHAQQLRVRIGWPISYGEAATIVTALFQGLAAAGRLLPVDAETWTEHATGNWYRPLRRTHWVGPWLPVPEEGTDREP